MPANAKKGHFFVDGESLCGNHILSFQARCLDTDFVLAGEDCRMCSRILPVWRESSSGVPRGT